MKVANVNREFLHISWTTWGNSMKFSGKLCFKIILKVTKNQGSTLSIEDTFFKKPQRSHFDPPGQIRVKILSMTTGNFWTYYGHCRVVSVYLTKIQGNKKKNVMKTLLNIFLTVKPEWPNLGVPKNLFNNFKFWDIKACIFTKINTPPWVFFTFINCANGTKSHNASQLPSKVPALYSFKIASSF